MYTSSDRDIDAFSMQSVNGNSGNINRPYSFDTATPSRTISGVYSTFKGIENNTYDFYYQHFDEKQSSPKLTNGSRHTIGSRLAGKKPRHEYAKRQLDKRGIKYEPLDHGILSCEDPQALQKICDEIDAAKIEKLLKKWLKRLPHPVPAKVCKAGFMYEVFMKQVEFGRTLVLDRPVSGRIFFEQMMRENLDLGRPTKMQLIFDKRIPRTTKTFRRNQKDNRKKCNGCCKFQNSTHLLQVSIGKRSYWSAADQSLKAANNTNEFFSGSPNDSIIGLPLFLHTRIQLQNRRIRTESCPM